MRPTDNVKVFVRGDINLADGHRFIARANVLDASAVAGSSSNTIYLMPGAYGELTDTSVSSVAQLNSTHNRLFNELRVGWQRQESGRADPAAYAPFPNVRVDMPEGSLIAGSDGLSHANGLIQDVVEVTDDLTWVQAATS